MGGEPLGPAWSLLPLLLAAAGPGCDEDDAVVARRGVPLVVALMGRGAPSNAVVTSCVPPPTLMSGLLESEAWVLRCSRTSSSVRSARSESRARLVASSSPCRNSKSAGLGRPPPCVR